MIGDNDLSVAKQLRWYRIVYGAAYRLGLVVWRRTRPPAGLVSLVEGTPQLPPGRALDLGCGTGTDTVYLAQHGWDVTAVDMVGRALRIAERSASRAGVTPRFVHGDVTRLPALAVGRDHDLVLDFGCLHTLPDDQRSRYVDGVTEVAAAGATLLLYGFHQPPRPAPMHAGLTLDEVRKRFGPAGWDVQRAEPVPEDLSPAGRRSAARFELWCYQLRRAG